MLILVWTIKKLNYYISNYAAAQFANTFASLAGISSAKA
jgi:hypothetical protein